MGRITGLKVARKVLAISHLFFADDSLLFFKATTTEAIVIKEVLKKYEVCSGQTINFSKSTVTFSINTHQAMREEIANILNVTESNNFGKYLGLPSIIGKNKKQVFNYIIEKISNRVGS